MSFTRVSIAAAVLLAVAFVPAVSAQQENVSLPFDLIVLQRTGTATPLRIDEDVKALLTTEELEKLQLRHEMRGTVRMGGKVMNPASSVPMRRAIVVLDDCTVDSSTLRLHQPIDSTVLYLQSGLAWRMWASPDATSGGGSPGARGVYFQLEARGPDKKDVWYSMKAASGETIEGFIFRWQDDVTAASGK